METLELVKLVNFIIENGDLDKYDINITIAPKSKPVETAPIADNYERKPFYGERYQQQNERRFERRENAPEYNERRTNTNTYKEKLPQPRFIQGDYPLTIPEFREKLKEIYCLRHYNFAYIKLDDERENILSIVLTKSVIKSPMEALKLPFITEVCYSSRERYLAFKDNYRDYPEYDEYIKENMPENYLVHPGLSNLFESVSEYKYLQIAENTYHMREITSLKVTLNTPLPVKKSSLNMLAEEFKKILI